MSMAVFVGHSSASEGELPSYRPGSPRPIYCPFFLFYMLNGIWRYARPHKHLSNKKEVLSTTLDTAVITVVYF